MTPKKKKTDMEKKKLKRIGCEEMQQQMLQLMQGMQQLVSFALATNRAANNPFNDANVSRVPSLLRRFDRLFRLFPLRFQLRFQLKLKAACLARPASRVAFLAPLIPCAPVGSLLRSTGRVNKWSSWTSVSTGVALTSIENDLFDNPLLLQVGTPGSVMIYVTFILLASSARLAHIRPLMLPRGATG